MQEPINCKDLYMNKQGLLLAIEGIDGSGKSSLAQKLYLLLQQNYDVLLTKEPGSTALGKEIRTIVQEQKMSICAKAEYLLFAADRAQHAQEIIIPALQQQMIVISDRMGDSSIVYQGYARGLDINMIKTINEWALNHVLPDVTIFVQIDPVIARQRCIERNQALSAFEKEQETFMLKVDNGFKELYKNRPNVILIDGNQSQNTVAQEAYIALKPWLIRYEQNKYTPNTTMAGISR